MASQPTQLHFLMIPLMAPGHFIPMVDMAKLLAPRGVTVTIVTTPLNLVRYRPALDQAIKIGLPIRFLEIPFRSVEAGLPEGCESVDTLPSIQLARNFFVAIEWLREPFEQCFETLRPSPSCIISDKHLAWTADSAEKFRIPRILFDGMSCFTELSMHNLYVSKAHEHVSVSEPFVIPGLPDRIELTRAQLPSVFNPSSVNMSDVRAREREAELKAYGVVINSFEELEQKYVDQYKKVRGGKVWCIGPLSLCNGDDLDKAHRGKKTAVDQEQCLRWLNAQESGSVIYACLGSISRLTLAQLVELALGLEASKRPFVWVIRAGDRTKEVEKWIEEEGFEEKINGRGLLIRDWAPQVLILSHHTIGGFLTHCGWNSTLEGVCAGVPMITWPQFAEQFLNEKLVVQVLGIGVGVGAQGVVHWGEEQKYGVKVKSEDLKKAIESVMDGGKEGEKRRKRAKEIGEIANGAIKEGRSSHRNLTLLIQYISSNRQTLFS